MARVVIIGGGISGCATAVAAIKAGAEVTLLERTDLLLGAALMAGYINQGGRFCLAEEAKAMGGGEILHVLESLNLTKQGKGGRRPLAPAAIAAQLTGYSFDLGRLEPIIRKLLQEMGIQMRLCSRAVDVKRVGDHLDAVKLASGEWLEGDAFVDCTGTSGGLANCIRYGKGCVMCLIFRCPTFGDRVSIVAKAGVQEVMARRPDGTPGLCHHAMHLYKESLSPELQETLRSKGRAAISIKHIVNPSEYTSVFYSHRVYQGLDPETGIAFSPETATSDPFCLEEMELGASEVPGLASSPNVPYLPYDKLRKIPGLENALIVFPQGGKSNVVWGLALTPRESSLRVADRDNLFVAGEKVAAIGVIECMVTGLLAGHNAVRTALGKKLVVLPPTTSTGDYIAFLAETMQSEENLTGFYGASSGLYLTRMVERNLFTSDIAKIKSNIEEAGLTNIYAGRMT
ncbi:FAD-dependent oxidoreductase [Chloroflexota bacterium]